MNNDRILQKIKKCLALAKSANANEAATALRQAQALMEQHGIEQADVLASEAAESRARASATKTPANWETHLADLVARAFGCDLIFSGVPGVAACWKFIGIGPKAEVASYSFAVLLRQCKAARSEHINAALKRCKRASKTRRADTFCDGWVCAVAATIQRFARSEEDTAIIKAYRDKHFPTTKSLGSRDRSGGRDFGDAHHGYRAGRNATLNHGVGAVGGAQSRIGHG